MGAARNILVIDVGGSNVKIIATGQDDRVKIPSGEEMTAQKMVDAVKDAAKDWGYEAVTIGYPGAVRAGKIVREPVNLADGWVDFDFAEAFGCPTQVMNDAAMQALGSYQGGKMLFLGLGTGLGTTLVADGTIVPLEAGHLPYRKGRSFEDYVGKDGYERLGDKKWEKHVRKVIKILRAATVVDDLVLGGGNADLIDPLPKNTRLGHNRNAFIGGFRLWGVEWEPPASL